MRFKKSAFTLVELLIVIAIIGVLVVFVVVAIQNTRKNSRDAKRIADIKQIQTALELYFNDVGQYPSEVTSTIAFGSNIYMTTYPTAPTPPDGDCSEVDNNYKYYSIGEDNSSYEILFCLGRGFSGFLAGIKIATPLGILDGGNYLTVTDGLLLHLDASEINNLNNGEQVNIWEDLSGNNFNAIGGSYNSGSKPTYESNYGGSPAVKFYGNIDGSYFDLGSNIYAKSVFFVVQVDSDAPNLSCLVTTKLNGYPWSIRLAGSKNWRISTDVNDWIYDGNKIYVNSSPTPSAIFPSNIDRHILYAEVGSNEASKYFHYIGASEYGNNRWFKGRISEVLFYDRKLTVEERSKVEDYLNEKWFE
jgi:prepilin-type N-terminal cleavage/methylation domain-containing protein